MFASSIFPHISTALMIGLRKYVIITNYIVFLGLLKAINFMNGIRKYDVREFSIVQNVLCHITAIIGSQNFSTVIDL